MTWLAKWDEFGCYAKFNYRGNDGYGTGFGGICSLLVTGLSAFFIVVQLYSFIFQTNYNQQQQINYLMQENLPSTWYDLQVSDFMPTFLV